MGNDKSKPSPCPLLKERGGRGFVLGTKEKYFHINNPVLESNIH
jgi:hypothetical protein